LAHKDMWTRKLLTDDEFIDWYLTRTKQLHVEITDEWKAMSEDIAENSILSEAMNQIDQMFQELSDSATETRNNRLADIEFEREYEANAFQERMAQYDAELNQANLNEAQRRKILLDREKTERDYRKKEHAWRKEEEELTKSATDRLATIAKESIKAGILAVAKEASAYAFLQVMKTVPFPFNLPLAIAAGAGAYGLVSAMAQFRTGGYTGEGNEWDEAGIVHKKEYVIDAPTTSAVGKENLDALRRGQAMVVPVESVRPVSVGGNMITSAIDSLSNELAINSSIANAESSREVVVINNSDFVEVTRMVDKTMKDYSSIGTNKSIRSFAK
jgi:multidrug efflux pump subunit AcrA (membrane-fusion protein)